ncbi:Transposase and inactivated derivatives, TnpA family [Citrobacter freundii]|nr:Transposase and inactivated derivatives, TnpA family [Citrobacter freundii]
MPWLEPICYGQRGEIRKRYREGQEDQLGALGLVTNAVVLWNTLYMQEALSHLRQSGEIPEEEHLARLSPLIHGHINMLAIIRFRYQRISERGVKAIEFQHKQ